MDTYGSLLAGMAQMDTFKADAFSGDEVCDQRTCNLVLALAAAHNDLHDCTMAMILAKAQAPKGEVKRTIEWAKSNGICQHIMRHHHSINHEILTLIADNIGQVKSDFFRKVTQNIKREARDGWQTIVEVAEGKKSGSDVGNYLHMLRNKVGSHYDLKKLGAGYRSKFVTDNVEQPLISRGNSSMTTRFYFADGAIEGVLFLPEDVATVENIIHGKHDIFGQINESIYFIVTNFITIRTGGFRRFSEASNAAPPKSPGR